MRISAWHKQPRLFTAAQMQQADLRAEGSGTPLYGLMLRAGGAVAREALERFSHVSEWHVLCGPGNNGGDGWVTALELLRHGQPAFVWELNTGRQLPAPAAQARSEFLREAQARPLNAQRLLAALEQRSSAGVIDALFANGLNRPLEGELRQLVDGLNSRTVPVVSIDVPTGLDPDLSRSEHPHVRADLTVALAGLKPAHVFEPARSSCGRIVLADIGFPKQVLKDVSPILILQAEITAEAVPPLDPAGHKYDAGTVCLVAGSSRYRGAAELAARAAWRSGAGLVTLVSDFAHANAWPETIFERHTGTTPWPPAGLDHRRAAALLIGPGLDPGMLEQLPDIIDWSSGPVVLDASALDPDAIAETRHLFRDQPLVLTPHHGEAERLLARFLPAEQALTRTNPLAAARLLAVELAALVVLKGPATVIASPAGQLAVSTRGHPALATGGTGDVLAGVITALLARPGGREELFRRVCAAVVVHGLAGELAAAELGAGTIASDVIGRLPQAFQLYG